MANHAGRDLLVKKNGTTIASLTTTSVTWNGTPIDITNKDDSGVVTYLSNEFATETLELTCEGYTDTDTLSDIAFATSQSGKHLTDISLVRANGDAITGTFIMTAYSESGTHDGAETFTCTFVRSGVQTWTPAV